MRVVGVAEKLIVDALRLMGIEAVAVETASEAIAAVEKFLLTGKVILVGETTAALMDERLEALKVKNRDCVILEIPCGGGPPQQAEKIARLVSQSIGIKV